jgi:hypothetical protein
MRAWKSLKVSVALAFALTSMIAAAQQYDIQRADYGAGNRRMDVTQRLREVVCSQTRFWMGNSTFGTDPAPEMKKSLRIYARANGREQMLEYPEKSTIDGAQFYCPTAGNWNGGGGDAGQYQILHAEYGTERNHVDVTDRLRELARADRIFRMGNSTFGFDPDHGQIKMLRIYTRGPDGRPRMFEYRESSTVDGRQFSGWERGEWGREGWNGGWNGDADDRDDGQYVILHAEYGTERNHVDVTDQLRELARADMTFRMGNSTFGIDPDHGRIKFLHIYARGRDGRRRIFEYQEGSTVDGAQFSGWRRGEWGREAWNGRWNDRDDDRDRDHDHDRDHDRDR